MKPEQYIPDKSRLAAMLVRPEMSPEDNAAIAFVAERLAETWPHYSNETDGRPFWSLLLVDTLWSEYSAARHASFLTVDVDSIARFIEWLREEVPEGYTGGRW